MTLALLHGFAGDPSAWDFVRVGGSLATTLPGHGRHGFGPPVAGSWDENLEIVAHTLYGADTVVGYSLGARVALGLLATGRIARAVLISVNPGIADADRPARRASDAVWAQMLRAEGVEVFADRWTAQPLFASQSRVPPTPLAMRRHHRLLHDPEQLARSLEVMGLAEMPDYRGAIPRDRVAVIAGADDAKYVALARAIDPAATIIADCGHDPTLEQPAALSDAILAALARLR